MTEQTENTMQDNIEYINGILPPQNPVPEDSTLPELCALHMVGTFTLELLETGEPLTFAFFQHGGHLHLYQRGNNLHCHVWHWVQSLGTVLENPRPVAIEMASQPFVEAGKRVEVINGA